MKDTQAPIFLDRRSYRERRLMDALRLLPFLAVLLWLLPVFWTLGAVSMSTAVTYVFAVWLLVILAAFALSRALKHRLRAEIEATKLPRDE